MVLVPAIGLIVVSPATLWLFERSIWNVERAAGWLAVVVVLLVLLAYYATGAVTFGPRYLCDILPLFFLLLVEVVRNRTMTIGFKRLILFSGLLNGVLFLNLG